MVHRDHESTDKAVTQAESPRGQNAMQMPKPVRTSAHVASRAMQQTASLDRKGGGAGSQSVIIGVSDVDESPMPNIGKQETHIEK